MSIDVATNSDYLIDSLRLYLGDINPATYQYTDAWLRTSLVLAIKALQRWWNYKYLVDTSYNVYRNTAVDKFLFPSPPIIENGDEEAIVLMAAIIIKEGTLQNSAWSVGSWKDAEISYSNIEASKLRDSSVKRDWDKLTAILKVPQKRLASALKGSLPGYKNNQWENSD